MSQIIPTTDGLMRITAGNIAILVERLKMKSLTKLNEIAVIGILKDYARNIDKD